ncbi:MAG: molybdenum cofactor guanylyltransferase [Armatimonadota bacterium]
MLGAVLLTAETKPEKPEAIDQVRQALRTHASRVLVFGPGGEGEADRIPLPPTVSLLGGLATILASAGTQYCIVAAADLRHPSSELLRYLLYVRGSFDAIVPERADGSLQPLFALYHPRCLGRARSLVAAGEHDPLRMLESLHVRRVSADEVAKFGSPDDLLARGA